MTVQAKNNSSGTLARKIIAVFVLAISGPAMSGIAWSSEAGIPLANSRHLFDAEAAKPALNLPTDIAVNSAYEIIVVDSGNDRVVIFDSTGNVKTSFGKPGTKDGQFRSPVGVGIDGKDNIYIADKGNARIQVFDRNGKFIRGFAAGTSQKPVVPVDVAPSADGKRLYVTDNKNHRVAVYSSEGRAIGYYGGEGVDKARFRYPATLTIAPTGNIYVVDVMNSRVQMLDAEGGHVIDVGTWGVQPGQLFRPKGVSIDDSGNVYVSDSYMELVQVFDAQHRFRHVVGSGNRIRRFEAPTGIVVRHDRLYVNEMLGNKISVYDLR
ncbi:MAG: NHL repeat-containing protein [Gammaproteobacteria bacterium]|nr:NHL repeat-containing protein [Gammaproteobacteria bacterium]